MGEIGLSSLICLAAALLTKPEALWLGAQVQENAPALHMKPCHSQKKKKKLDVDDVG